MFSLDQIKEKLRNHKGHVIEDTSGKYVPASVLILLFESDIGLEVVLTKRTTTLKTHKGQIAFPGGAVDKTDTSKTVTALRESFEEIGTDSNQIEILGILDEIITISDFIVTPVVGFSATRLGFTPNEHEIEKIFSVPLHFLFSPQQVRIEEWVRNGISRKVYFWNYDGETIWGLTGEIIRNFGETVAGKDIFSEVGISQSTQTEFLSKIIAD